MKETLSVRLIVLATLSAILVGSSPAFAAAPQTAGGVKCTIWGNAGPNSLVGTSGNDVICGLGGDDEIDGAGGTDVIDGGTGDDTIDAGEGTDEVFGGAGEDELWGGPGGDLLFGGDGSDALNAGDGNDIVQAGAGNDTVELGEGADRAYGGAGGDRLFGDDGEDQIFGDAGTDWLGGGSGTDVLNGGKGVTYCDSVSESVSGSCFFDNAPPILVSVAVAPDSREIFSGTSDAVVSIRARIVDFGTGLDAANFVFTSSSEGDVWAGMNNPARPSFSFSEASYSNEPQCDDGHAIDVPFNVSAEWQENSSVCRISGDSNDGIYEFNGLQSPFLKTGQYRLTSFIGLDNSNYRTNLEAGDLSSLNLDVSFRQSAAVDAKAPTINSIAIDPSTSFNTSTGPATVRVRFNYRDNENPMDNALLCFAKTKDLKKLNAGKDVVRYCVDYLSNLRPGDPGNRSFWGCPSKSNTSCNDLSQVSGTGTNTVFSGEFTLPVGYAPGKFRLVDVIVRDLAYNVLRMDAAKLAKSTTLANIGFTQSGAGVDPQGDDSATPTPTTEFDLISVSSNQPQISTALGAAFIDLTVRASISAGSFSRLGFWIGVDDDSNTFINADTSRASQGTVKTCPAEGPSDGQGCLESGTLQNGTFKYRFVIPAHHRSGTFKIKYIHATVPGYQNIHVYDLDGNPISPNIAVDNR